MVAAMSALSSREVADHLGCGYRTVQRIREELAQPNSAAAKACGEFWPKPKALAAASVGAPPAPNAALPAGVLCECRRWQHASTIGGNFGCMPADATFWMTRVSACPRCKPRANHYLILYCVNADGARVVGLAQMNGVTGEGSVTENDLRAALHRIVMKTGAKIGAVEADNIVDWAVEFHRNSGVDLSRRKAA